MWVLDNMTTETRWAIGIMATIGAVIVTIILGFQANVDGRQDAAHKELAAVVLEASKQLERASVKLDIMDSRGTTAEQERRDREAERWLSGQKTR